MLVGYILLICARNEYCGNKHVLKNAKKSYFFNDISCFIRNFQFPLEMQINYNENRFKKIKVGKSRAIISSARRVEVLIFSGSSTSIGVNSSDPVLVECYEVKIVDVRDWRSPFSATWFELVLFFCASFFLKQ